MNVVVCFTALPVRISSISKHSYPPYITFCHNTWQAPKKKAAPKKKTATKKKPATKKKAAPKKKTATKKKTTKKAAKK